MSLLGADSDVHSLAPEQCRSYTDPLGRAQARHHLRLILPMMRTQMRPPPRPGMISQTAQQQAAAGPCSPPACPTHPRARPRVRSQRGPARTQTPPRSGGERSAEAVGAQRRVRWGRTRGRAGRGGASRCRAGRRGRSSCRRARWARTGAGLLCAPSTLRPRRLRRGT